LPQPEGPTIVTSSPRLTVTVIESRASVPSPNVCATPVSASTAAAAVEWPTAKG
jgi:hypothetical protein